MKWRRRGEKMRGPRTTSGLSLLGLRPAKFHENDVEVIWNRLERRDRTAVEKLRPYVV